MGLLVVACNIICVERCLPCGWQQPLSVSGPDQPNRGLTRSPKTALAPRKKAVKNPPTVFLQVGGNRPDEQTTKSEPTLNPVPSPVLPAPHLEPIQDLSDIANSLQNFKLPQLVEKITSQIRPDSIPLVAAPDQSRVDEVNIAITPTQTRR